MTSVLLKQAHLVWIVSIYNIGIGFFIAGFNPIAQSISEVALEAPAFAYTHRLADIVIGTSMCGFALALNLLSNRRLNFSMISISLLGLSMVSAGIWTLETSATSIIQLVFLHDRCAYCVRSRI